MSAHEHPGPYSQRPAPSPASGRADHPPTRPRRSLGLRVLGWTLLTGSVGLVSCQALFFP